MQAVWRSMIPFSQCDCQTWSFTAEFKGIRSLSLQDRMAEEPKTQMTARIGTSFMRYSGDAQVSCSASSWGFTLGPCFSALHLFGCRGHQSRGSHELSCRVPHPSLVLFIPSAMVLQRMLTAPWTFVVNRFPGCGKMPILRTGCHCHWCFVIGIKFRDSLMLDKHSMN